MNSDLKSVTPKVRLPSTQTLSSNPSFINSQRKVSLRYNQVALDYHLPYLCQTLDIIIYYEACPAYLPRCFCSDCKWIWHAGKES